MKRKILLTILVVVAIFTLAACTPNRTNTGLPEENNQSDQPTQPSQPGQSNEPVQPQKPAKATITLYFTDEDGMGLVAVEREIELEDKSLEQRIIEELIAGPGVDNMGITIPEGTKLLSIKVEAGVAYVDFSEEIRLNHWGGSFGDAITLNSIILSLTEVEGIEKVQFLIEGGVEESIFGHVYTVDPFERDESIVIKK